MDKDTITIHAMFPIAHHQAQTTIHDIDTALLSRGRAIARAGCGMAGWRTHGTRSATCARDRFLGNAFTYVFPPPLASTTADVSSCAVKEWNTRPSESEIFTTNNLQPFESTLFNPLPSQPLIGQPVVPVQDRNQHWLDDPPQPPKKRVKVNVDVGPLDELIPLPHYVPAPPDAQTALPHSPPDLHPSSVVPIPPQTTSSLEGLLASIYARVAWLIPVRGAPPWDDVSRASIALGNLSGLGTAASDIVWTHGALRQFWTFLCSCSETLGSVTGPLSLSFHTTRRFPSTRSQQGTTSHAASSCHLANKETEMTPSNLEPLMPIVSALKPGLTDMDYVKVYCDAPRAMSVRRMLAQWTYKGEGGAEDARTVGFLEFAKLVLINESGEGVLIL